MRKVLYVLGELEDSDLQWLLDAGRARSAGAGETLIHEGQRLDELFIVLQGELVVRVGPEGGTEIARLGPGAGRAGRKRTTTRPSHAGKPGRPQSTESAQAQPATSSILPISMIAMTSA
jgi:hypothetical protein